MDLLIRQFHLESPREHPMATGWARIALYLAPEDPLAGWYREALDHAGMRVETLGEWMPSELARTHVLLLCGRGQLNNLQAEGLAAWVENGGSLVVSGSEWNLESLIGATAESGKHNSVAYASPSQPDRLWPEAASRVKAFGSRTLQASTAQTLAKIGDGAVLTRQRCGKGHVFFVGFHFGQQLTQMTLGRSVEVDGIGAQDGTAQLDDGVLRAEDGHALDFDADRMSLGDGSEPFFGEPHADVVREIWLRAVFQGIELTQQSAAALWLWPNNANSVATLTVDVHDFEVDRVITMRRMLQMFGCPATWMVAMPGYGADVYRALRAMEHEVGLLFQIEDVRGWHEERLRIQFTNLMRLASWPAMTSVRVDQGQWQGWTKFYEWCEHAGSRASLNKMGRQPGTAGFLFGTCQPLFPLSQAGTGALVCEMPGQVWAPGLVTSENVCAALVERCDQQNGMLQVAMEASSIADSMSTMALRRILSTCKERRITFVKPGDIYKFLVAKRNIKLIQKHVGDTDLLQLASDQDVTGLTVMITGERRFARDRHGDIGAFEVERYGTTFSAVTLDLKGKTLTDIEWMPAALVNKAA